MIRPAVLANALEIQHRFQQASPFRHVAIDDFLEPRAAESLLADFPPFDTRKAVNELGEVGRKAVFEHVSGISAFYREFYRYINSKPFLEAMSELTGIPDLIADETLFGGGSPGAGPSSCTPVPGRRRPIASSASCRCSTAR